MLIPLRRSPTVKALLGAALLVALAAPAHADGASELDRGLELYNDLDYEEAIVVLERALAAPGSAPRPLVVRSFEALALSNLALGREAEAEATFEQLLRYQPTYELPGTMSRDAARLFARAREKVPMPIRPEVALRHDLRPSPPQPGSPLDVVVRIEGSADAVARLAVYHRPRGSKPYSSVWATRIGDAFSVTISGSLVAAPALEYYVVALGRDGEPVAAIGSAGEPLALPIGAPEPREERSRPIYGRWWFWAGVGGVVVAGVAAAVLATGGDGGDDASVTVTINPPED